MKHDGKATFLAFELPDMSVNRGLYGTPEDARKGFDAEEWGVVSLRVRDMPPREAIPQASHWYHFLARHVPAEGNFAHSEVRVWRVDDRTRVLISVRQAGEFEDDDPDKESDCTGPDALDPEFHMRWRKRIEWRCKPELRPGVVKPA
jgi:hypothetical protein